MLPEHAKAFHAMYISIFNLPVNLSKKSALLSTLMGARPDSWRVAGVSVNALEALEQNGYASVSSLQRAHVVARVDIAKELFDGINGEPFAQDQFFKRFAELDRTVLVDSAKSENKTRKPLPWAAPIPEDVLVCRCQAVGYSYTKEDAVYFRELHDRYKAGTLDLVGPWTLINR